MNKCGGYLEILSAYADGEVSGAQAREIEAHLNQCEQCSKLLAIYRQIPVAIAENMEPVPEMLARNVMSQITDENPAVDHLAKSPAQKPAKDTASKPRPRIVISRLMPVAACIVVALVAWGIFGNLRNTYDEAAPQNAYSVTGGGNSGAGGIATDEAADIDIYGDGSAPAGAMGESGTFTERQESSAAAPESSAGGSAAAKEENEEEALSDAEEKRVQTIIMPEELSRTNQRYDDTNRTGGEAAFIATYIDGASYWITIIGEMPDTLATLEPEKTETHFGWEIVYKIPSGEVDIIVKELTLHNEATTATQNATSNTLNFASNSLNQTAPYAVILYAPER